MRVSDQSARISLSYEQAIPRVVYSTFRTKRLTRGHFNQIQKFRNQNQEYSFVVLDKNNQHDYVSSKFKGERIKEIYERTVFGQMQADIVRIALMLFEGGVYIDGTKRLTTPLSEVIPPTARFVFAHERNIIPPEISIKTDERILRNHRNTIVPWCMMSSSGFPIFKTMVEFIERDSALYENVVFENPKTAILKLTGTYQYTTAVWRHLLNGIEDVHYAGIDFGEDFADVPIRESFGPKYKRHYSSVSNQYILKPRK